MTGLTPERAAAATSAQTFNRERFPALLRFVTDTRTLTPGDVFLALRGENYDGHAFVAQALSAGASGLVVDDASAIPPNVPALLVADTKRAYMDLAAEARRGFAGQVIAITGSAGKTTTKHLLAQMLSAYFGPEHVLATPSNENNEIGVSRLLLQASSNHRVLVVEMGARHDGEIAELVAIAHPHIGVLTNIGEAHVETFGSRESLARTKWGLFSNGASAVVNARDSESVIRAASLQTPPRWFGTGEPAVPGVWVRDERTLVISDATRREEYPLELHLPGAHNRSNLAAAIAAALLAGVPASALTRSAATLSLPAGRYQSIPMAGGARIIYDAYNANASGMIAALDAFASETAERRVAVLASMAELGAQAPALHEQVGAHAAATRVDTLLLGGEFAMSMAAGAVAAGFPRERIVRFTSNDDAARWLRDHVGPRDAVLLKGSRKYKMEEIVTAVRGES